ncbi:methyltransferase domain-containing protein [bacterium]|nr:methyltransferase domain-containing protein [bacterium]
MTKSMYYRELTPSGIGIAIKVNEILFSVQSKYQKIEILDLDSSLGRMLTLNDIMFVIDGNAHYYNEIFVHLPMLSHKNPENILIIGGGTGAAAKEVLKHNTVKNAVVVDIDDMVINACKKFMPKLANSLNDTRVSLKIMDAFDYIKNTDKTFDVILISSPDPLGPGVGTYNDEVYKNLKKVLNKDGIIVIQSESPVANVQKSKILYKNLMNNFKIVKSFKAPVPTYPGGNWAWAFCSDTVKPLDNYNEQNFEYIAEQCKLFNRKYAEKRLKQETLLDDLY